jgi:hypothetical protein
LHSLNPWKIFMRGKMPIFSMTLPLSVNNFKKLGIT